MPGDPRGAEAFFAHLGPFTTLLFWLGPVNIVRAVFNLVPGFPLDGGHLLRSEQRAWPVVDRGRIRGLISRGDVLRWLAVYGSGSERPIRDAGRN